MNIFKYLTLIICLSIMVNTTIIAQYLDCGTQLLQDQVDYMDETRVERANTSISLFSDDEEETDLILAIHIIRDNNKQKGLSLEELDGAIDYLNEAFEPVNFRFNVCSINYIDNDDYASSTLEQSISSNSLEYQMALPALVENAINVFFVPEISICGWSAFPSYKAAYGKDWIVMKNLCTPNSNILAHEIGHYFNLYHTFQGPNRNIDIFEYELVDGSNCGPNVGDELCDTPADPQFINIREETPYELWRCTARQSCEIDHTNIVDGCNITDENGDLYTPDPTNIMSYSYFHCQTNFSPKQIERMQRSYLHDRDYLSNNCEVSCDNMLAVFNWLRNEVSCEEGIPADITIYTDNNDVWNYIDLQRGNERTLFLSNGVEVPCSSPSFEDCLTQIGLTTIIAECAISCICEESNACNNGELGICIIPNTPCNDGYSTTFNDKYNENCECEGTPLPKTCDVIFEQYTWLPDKINCDNDEITVYSSTNSNYVYVKADDEWILYKDDGQYWCSRSSGDDYCLEYYGFANEQIIDGCICAALECENEVCSDQLPNWPSLSPTNLSGTFRGQVEIDDIPANRCYWLAAFDQNNNLVGIDSLTIYQCTAYINMPIYGDDATTPNIDEGMNEGEYFTLQLFDVSENLYYDYVVDGQVVQFTEWENTNGIPIDIYSNEADVYHFSATQICTQTIHLNAGWNLISLDLSPQNPAIDSVFNSLQQGNLKFVTSHENGAIINEVGAPPILNTLKTIIDGAAYWVFVQNDDVLTITGTCIDENYRMPLTNGWNLMGYIPHNPVAPADYFNDLINNNSLEFVTGYDKGIMVYNPNGSDFLNTLQQLENGYGYWVKTNTASKTTQNQSNVFSFISGKSNLPIGEQVEVLNQQDEVIATINIVEDNYLMTTPIYGDDLTTTTFIEGVTIGEELRFSWNKQLANVSTIFKGDYGVEKLQLEFKTADVSLEQVAFKLHPNPTNGIVNISLNFEPSTASTLILYNLTGKIIKQETFTGANTNVNLSEVAKGMYIIEIQNGDKQSMQKLIIE